MRRIWLPAVIAALAIPAAVPMATANHGMHGLGTFAFASGAEWTVTMDYQFGDGNRQFWAFSFFDGLAVTQCVGIGSVENGFREAATCAHDFSLAGTGDYHEYGNLATDEHDLAFSFNGASGTFRMTLLPDTPM